LRQVLTQQRNRLLDLALGRLGRLGQVAGVDGLRREEEQRFDGAGQVAHAVVSFLQIWIGPKGSSCSQVASPLRYMSSKAKRVTAWVNRSSSPNCSSKSILERPRSASRRAARRFCSETVGRMWSRLSSGGSVSRSPRAAPRRSGS